MVPFPHSSLRNSVFTWLTKFCSLLLNDSPVVFFIFEVFSKRPNAPRIGCRFWNSQSAYCGYIVFTYPLLIWIVRSYRAAIFVLLGDIFKARAMFGSRYRAVKKPYGATLNVLQRDRDLLTHALYFVSSTWHKCRIRKRRSPSPAENEFVTLYV